jgi:hypothetical protein
MLKEMNQFVEAHDRYLALDKARIDCMPVCSTPTAWTSPTCIDGPRSSDANKKAAHGRAAALIDSGVVGQSESSAFAESARLPFLAFPAAFLDALGSTNASRLEYKFRPAIWAFASVDCKLLPTGFTLCIRIMLHVEISVSLHAYRRGNRLDALFKCLVALHLVD